jgi:hypothetical protein
VVTAPNSTESRVCWACASAAPHALTAPMRRLRRSPPISPAERIFTTGRASARYRASSSHLILYSYYIRLFADYYLTDDNAVVVPRLNSIMMTSAAAMRGALPFAIGLEDGELRRRLGIAILSGLIVSQMLTLCTPR